MEKINDAGRSRPALDDCYGSALAQFLLELKENEAHPALLNQRARLAQRASELAPGTPEFQRLLDGIRFLCYIPPPTEPFVSALP